MRSPKETPTPMQSSESELSAQKASTAAPANAVPAEPTATGSAALVVSEEMQKMLQEMGWMKPPEQSVAPDASHVAMTSGSGQALTGNSSEEPCRPWFEWGCCDQWSRQRFERRCHDQWRRQRFEHDQISRRSEWTTRWDKPRFEWTTSCKDHWERPWFEWTISCKDPCARPRCEPTGHYDRCSPKRGWAS